MKTHYIAMAGLHGYMPQYCEVYESKRDAADALIDLHEADESEHLTELLKYNYTDLELSEHGNEYAEIVECYCDDPQEHSEHEIDF